MINTLGQVVHGIRDKLDGSGNPIPIRVDSGINITDLGSLSSPGVTEAVETKGAPTTFQVSTRGTDRGAISYRFEGSLTGAEDDWFNLSASEEDETIENDGVLGYHLNAPVRFARMRLVTAPAVVPFEYVEQISLDENGYSNPYSTSLEAEREYKLRIEWWPIVEESPWPDGDPSRVAISVAFAGGGSMVNYVNWTKSQAPEDYETDHRFTMGNVGGELNVQYERAAEVLPYTYLPLISLYNRVSGIVDPIVRCHVGCA